MTDDSFLWALWKLFCLTWVIVGLTRVGTILTDMVSRRIDAGRGE